MLKSNEWINDLIVWYGSLLTENQLNIMESYYQADLSLAEIAENNQVSRSAIHATIKRSEELLLGYEAKLKVVEKFKERSKKYILLKDLKISEVDKIVKDLEKIE
ncbi:MAG: DNA-binding protein [Erysipelothrix sp.]|nr:DNA-binding protein [Erysipelothrix sp.]